MSTPKRLDKHTKEQAMAQPMNDDMKKKVQEALTDLECKAKRAAELREDIISADSISPHVVIQSLANFESTERLRIKHLLEYGKAAYLAEKTAELHELLGIGEDEEEKPDPASLPVPIDVHTALGLLDGIKIPVKRREDGKYDVDKESKVYVEAAQGHGHVRPLLSQNRARCGGPSLCNVCALEQWLVRQNVLPTEPPANA